MHYPRELVHIISTDYDQNYRTSRLLYEQRLLVFCPKIQNPSSFSTGPIPEIMCAKFRNQNWRRSMKHWIFFFLWVLMSRILCALLPNQQTDGRKAMTSNGPKNTSQPIFNTHKYSGPICHAKKNSGWKKIPAWKSNGRSLSHTDT